MGNFKYAIFIQLIKPRNLTTPHHWGVGGEPV